MSATLIKASTDGALLFEIKTIDELFPTGLCEIGQRLGVNYMQSQKEELTLTVCGQEITLTQSQMGVLAISSVVWDAGMLLCDFLSTHYSSLKPNKLLETLLKGRYPLGHVLDLGAGTGVAGIACYCSGAASVTFSDVVASSLLTSNIEDNIPATYPHIIIPYNWLDNNPSPYLKHPKFAHSKTNTSSSSSAGESVNPSCPEPESEPVYWDTIIGSDVLYESKSTSSLLILLQSVKFHKLIITYKQRHNQAEALFFTGLCQWCDVYVLDTHSTTTSATTLIDLYNLPVKALANLHLIIAVPKADV